MDMAANQIALVMERLDKIVRANIAKKYLNTLIANSQLHNSFCHKF